MEDMLGGPKPFKVKHAVNLQVNWVLYSLLNRNVVLLSMFSYSCCISTIFHSKSLFIYLFSLIEKEILNDTGVYMVLMD